MSRKTQTCCCKRRRPNPCPNPPCDPDPCDESLWPSSLGVLCRWDMSCRFGLGGQPFQGVYGPGNESVVLNNVGGGTYRGSSEFTLQVIWHPFAPPTGVSLLCELFVELQIKFNCATGMFRVNCIDTTGCGFYDGSLDLDFKQFNTSDCASCAGIAGAKSMLWSGGSEFVCSDGYYGDECCGSPTACSGVVACCCAFPPCLPCFSNDIGSAAIVIP